MAGGRLPAHRPHVALAIEFLHNASGGAERVLVDVANGLHRRGYRVTVLTYQNLNGPSFYPLDFGIERRDGKAHHSPDLKRPPLAFLDPVGRQHASVALVTWLLKHGPRTYRMRRLLRATRPDVVVAFMPSMFPYVTLAALGTGIKTVASLHNVPARELGGDPERWDQNPFDIKVRRWSLGRADATTVLLPSFVGQLPAPARPRAVVVPNMVTGFGDTRADVVAEPDGNTILAVGRLSSAKDHATLVRAWARIESRFPAWQVRIIGTGPLLEDLRRLRADLSVERLSFEEPTSQIGAVYATAKILAMPSRFEGFGLVTAEAMACGVPAIGFADCPGTNEIIVPGVNGVLVAPREDRAAAFADELARLIEDDALRSALASRAPASVARFAPEATLDQWEQLVSALTERR